VFLDKEREWQPRQGSVMRWVKLNLIIFITLLIVLPVHAQFTKIGLDDRSIQELQLHDDFMYAGTDQGLYRVDLSSDGFNWELLSFQDHMVSSFVVFSRDTLLVGLGESAPIDSVYLYRTNNGGARWDFLRDGPGSDSTEQGIVDLDWVGSGSYTMYAVTQTGIYRSPNRGDSWDRLDLDTESIYRSQQPKRASGTFEFQFVNAVYNGNPALFTGGKNGYGNASLLYSRDAGETWITNSFTDVDISGEDQYLMYANDAIMPIKNSKPIFSAVGSKVLKSSQEVFGTLNLSAELYHAGYEFLDLAVPKNYAGVIYAGGNNADNGIKLFKSSDGGNHWNMFQDTTVQTSGIRSLVVSKGQSDGHVYIGTTAGVYRLNDDAQSVPADIKPTVEIIAPTDSSKRYYLDTTNTYYQGVEVHFSGSDIDGQIEKYGWALGEQPYTWTSDSVNTIKNETFGSSGSFTLRAIALDDDSLRSSADTVQFELINPSLNQGVLVVDGTNEKDFDRVSHLDQLTDTYIDSLYESWISPLAVTQWDIHEDGLPPHQVMGKYNLVYWHADNWYGSSSNAHPFGSHISVLSDYMGAGGDFILSGWKVLRSIYPQAATPIYLDSLAFPRQYLKVHSIGGSSNVPPGDFVGAHGVGKGYSDVIIDSSRVKGYPVGFYDFMVDVNLIQSSAANTDSIYTFRCRDECSDTVLEGEVVGQITQNRIYNSAVLGFPLVFLEEPDAAGTVHQIMDDFGYEVTSIPRTQQPDRVRLKNNYPNPFNPSTTIRFELPQASDVQLSVYNTIGQKVSTLVNQNMSAGSHSITFNAEGLPSGVYIYRLKAEGFSQSRKMLLVK